MTMRGLWRILYDQGALPVDTAMRVSLAYVERPSILSRECDREDDPLVREADHGASLDV